MNSRKKIAVMYQRSVKKRDTNSIVRVERGRSALSSSNNGLNCGRTYPARIITVTRPVP